MYQLKGPLIYNVWKLSRWKLQWDRRPFEAVTIKLENKINYKGKWLARVWDYE